MAENNRVTAFPVEPDFPIGGPVPEATIQVEGDTSGSNLRSFSIESFRNRIEGTDGPDILFGTPGDDEIIARGGDDTILGTLGDDLINGGEGFDTLDYSFLRREITLLPQGFLGNGDSQGSQIQSIERIVGAPREDNTIDGSGGQGIDVFFTINLADELLVVENIPRLGSVTFEVENFVNVEGTENSDSIIGDGGKNKLSGNGGNDSLTGGLGRDTILGGSGDDILIGTDPSVQDTVRREKDTLTGGSGGDTFVLGNELGSFYDDFGRRDFARVTDFSFGDKIQLGSGETYNIKQKRSGFDIFLVEDSGEDLIAKVKLSFGIAARKIGGDAIKNSSSDALSPILPEGDFQLSSGEELGNIFIA